MGGRVLKGTVKGALIGCLSAVLLTAAFWAVVAVLRTVNLVPASPSGTIIMAEAGTYVAIAAIVGIVAGAIEGAYLAFANE